ncbi:MAG: hypothetical protein QXJ02_00545, partial [Candidatus Bathyarchaeia archaeon]
NATVLDIYTNSRIGSEYHPWVEFVDWRSDGSSVSLRNVSAVDGVTLWSVVYPDDGLAHAYMARIVPEILFGKFPQGIASNPVQLTALHGNSTLSLNVSKGGGFNHTVAGVLTCEGLPVSGRMVEVKVNGTSVANVTTHADGSFTVIMKLRAVEDKATLYQIETIFYGDSALNLTAIDTLPNGTSYTVCTTLQYFSLKPSANATMLTVEPATTQATQTTKTPEQMQQEGWLSVWHEFTWRYPWYRLHVKYLANTIASFDIGTSFLPFGDSFLDMGNFMQRIITLLPRVIWSIFGAIVAGEFFSLVMSSSGTGFVVGFLASFAMKGASIAVSWHNADGLISIFIATFFTTVITGLKVFDDIFDIVLNLLEGFTNISESSLLTKTYRMLSTAINLALMSIIGGRLKELGVSI